MGLPMSDLTQAWANFEAAASVASRRSIRSLFDEPGRLDRLTAAAPAMTLDLAKQPWDLAAFDAALYLARAAGLEQRRGALFAGEPINISEGRPALHMALRAPEGAEFYAYGDPVCSAVEASRRALRRFAEGVRSGQIAGSSGKPFNAVLHIGIGGSDLGPRLVWEALRPLDARIDLRFVANVDGADIAAATAALDPAQTLVIVVSKTFTTQETMANARAARAWLAGALGEAAVGAHLAAVSTNLTETARFGVADERVFGFWDWVGGRYSLWSAVGLSCAIGLGWEAFQGLLDGAAAMDEHFRTAPLEANAPVLLALSHVFNRNGLGRPIRAVVPYAQRLRLLPAHLQQLEMESNGKRVSADGRAIAHSTAASVFGDAGTNGQHAFFQLLHQGTDIIPVDFIAAAQASEGPPEHQAMLLANCLAQAEALMVGRSEAEVRAELTAAGMDAKAIDALAPQRTFPGERPSNLILLDQLRPYSLGALIALYEHKTFVEGAIWGINSFDQWGVELGKTLATRILAELTGGPPGEHDPSTAALIERLKP
jgi:glucose-6-phosphate isomerase